MSKGRTASRDYENCTMVMIPIDDQLYTNLKIWGLQHGVPTVKEILHDVVEKGIKEKVKSGK
jgi:hypothetical protein